MNVTHSVDDNTVREARRRAEAMGTSVNQLVREYLEQFAGKTDNKVDAAEFERLSRMAEGNSRGWKFNREELHQRSRSNLLRPSRRKFGHCIGIYFLDSCRVG